MLKRSNWSLIGVPDHLGVLNVGGRIGAALGPSAFRKAFRRLQPASRVRVCLTDSGDVPIQGSDLPLNLKNAANQIAAAHLLTGLSVVVGGGHDHGYSHLLGINQALSSKKRKLKLGCINIDAHLDVRRPDPLITSGSPFYLALEAEVLEPNQLIEFGIQSHCNADALWVFVKENKVPVVPLSRLRLNATKEFKKALNSLKKKCDAVVVSFDLDAVAAAFSPGVSAPQAEGFSPSDIIQMMEISGEEKKVVSLGIFELNPIHDIGDRTALLAATAAFHFIEKALERKN
ncbi:MAG: formimidoylglutamase [Bdellovibrionota bacterium]